MTATHVLIFGPGFTGQAIAKAFIRSGDHVDTIGRAIPADWRRRIAAASHIVSTVPPGPEGDPILAAFGDAITASGAALTYLSSTGVYGDAGGGWVDEAAPLTGRRRERIRADAAWLERGAAVLRLPGIYGPGRSVVDRLRDGTAHRVDLPEQVFSRIHVEDVAAAVLATAERRPAGAFNIADDLPCAQAEIVAWAAARLGVPVPPLLPLAEAGLSPAALAFYGENRRVASERARRMLGWRPRFPDFRAGLAAIVADAREAVTSETG